MTRESETYQFDNFRLDVGEHRLTRVDGQTIGSLPEKAFQTLVHLVRHCGILLTKEELLEAVWPDTAVEENNLVKAIYAIRRCLDDMSDSPRFIETVPKHGYRFIANVCPVTTNGGSWERVPNAPMLTASGKVTAAAAMDGKLEPKSVTRLGSMLIYSSVTILLLAAIAFGYLYIVRRDAGIQPKRGTTNEEAFRYYQMAKNLSDQRGIQNLQRSLEMLDQAIALDPKFAPAWASKALIHNDIVGHTDSEQDEHYKISKEAINIASAIDPNLSDPYSALCGIKNRYEYDMAGAEAACKRAVELDPNSPEARRTYSKFLYSRGRFDEAMSEIKVAMDIQPVSYRNQQIYALTLYFAHRYDESEAQFKRLIELNINLGFVYSRLVGVLAIQGKESEAYEYLIKMLAFQKADEAKIQRYKTVYSRSGWSAVVREQITSAEADATLSSFQLACLYANIGDKDKSFHYLAKAYDEHSFQISVLQVEPQLDPLRRDKRYHELVNRIGLE